MKTMQATSLIAGLLLSASIFAADTSKSPLPLSVNPGQGFTQEGLKRSDGSCDDGCCAKRNSEGASRATQRSHLWGFRKIIYSGTII